MDPIQQFVHSFVHNKTTAGLLADLSRPDFALTPHGTAIPPGHPNPFVDGLIDAGFSRQEAQAFYETVRDCVLARHQADLRMAADLHEDGVRDIDDWRQSTERLGEPSVDNLPNAHHQDAWPHQPAHYNADGTPRPPEHLLPAGDAPHPGPHAPGADPGHPPGGPHPGAHPPPPGEAFRPNPAAPHGPGGDVPGAPHGDPHAHGPGRPHLGALDWVFVVDAAIQDVGGFFGNPNHGFVHPVIKDTPVEKLLHRIELATPATTKLVKGIEQEFGHTASVLASIVLIEIQVGELMWTGGIKIGNAASEFIFPEPVINALATFVVFVDDLPDRIERTATRLVQRIEEFPDRVLQQAEAIIDYVGDGLNNLAQNAEQVAGRIDGFLDEHGVLTPSEIAHNVLNPVSSFNAMLDRIEDWSF
jgi:hypothetical protein